MSEVYSSADLAAFADAESSTEETYAHIRVSHAAVPRIVFAVHKRHRGAEAEIFRFIKEFTSSAHEQVRISCVVFGDRDASCRYGTLQRAVFELGGEIKV